MSRFEGCYLAYPIDQRGPASLAFLFDQINKFAKRLRDEKIVDWTFDPGEAFRIGIGAKPGHGVMRINRTAAWQADCLVAFLPSGVASIGVPIEIDRAVKDGIPTLVFSDAKAWMLEYNAPHFLKVEGYEDEHLEYGFGWLAGQEPRENRYTTDPLPVKITAAGGQMPVRAYERDAGLDLFVSEDTVIPSGEFVDIPCGIAVELPFWSWGLVTGRSSALRTKGLLVHSGIIDEGYRGELFAGAWNTTKDDVKVLKGERVAQLIIINNGTRQVSPVQTDGLTDSPRSTNGFGSTGA